MTRAFSTFERNSGLDSSSELPDAMRNLGAAFGIVEYKEMAADTSTPKPNYNVKKVEAIVVGTDVQARLFTLDPFDVIPWHHHSACTDYYFVLRGALTIETRSPDGHHLVHVGSRHQLTPGTVHRISNGGAEDCEFLLIQGIGKPDWIKAGG
jgi:quercetin dioxygenase-like cupin family protein